MTINEVYADGIGSLQIVGGTVRLQFVSVEPDGGGGRFAPRVRVVLPLTSLDSMIHTLTSARRSVQAARPEETGPG
jgi:hypothetical protein